MTRNPYPVGMDRHNYMPAQSNPYPEIETCIVTMGDSSRTEEDKLRAIQDMWDRVDVYLLNTTSYNHLERFIKALISYLTDSIPKFIDEHPIQKVRKKSLDFIVRLAIHEVVRNLNKEITKCLLRLIQIDNETNAVLALKIIADVWRHSKTYFMPEKNFQISACTSFLKNVVKDMGTHLNNGYFDVQDCTRNGISHMDDPIIERYLERSFRKQPISFGNPVRGPDGRHEPQYNLIPRSSQSIKVIHELNVYFVYLYQHHKGAMLSEVMDFLVIALEFICLQVPSNYREYQGLAKELLDEFHKAQAKLLAYITIIGKIPQFLEVIVKNSNSLVNAILTILETLCDKAVDTRKEVLLALKFCFTSEIRNHVVRFLPRLLDEESILGKGFTSKDNLRIYLYQGLADLLHHIRFQLTFPLLLQASAVFCREMNDPSISFQTQIMCVRLLCSLSEALPKMETQGEATRDVLWQTLDSLQYKLEKLATYHLPLLARTHGLEDASGRRITNHEFLQTEKASTSTEKSKEEASRNSEDTPTEEQKPGPSEADLPLPPYTKTNKHTAPDVMLNSLNAVNSPPMTIIEARSFIKFLLVTVKVCCVNLVNTSRSNLSYPIEKERDIMENILKYGLINLDIFLLPYNNKSQQMPGQQQRSKEEKESLDCFAHVFVSMDFDIYREIFAKHIYMLIERINCNSAVQLFANAFLVRSDWVYKFGSIMIKYLMENMDKLAVSNERTALYVKLFKIIFSAIGCGQHVTTEGELMLKPYLSDLIRKATEYALTAKEPLNYFLLLRALFRSIGGGAHDILYGQFLPLLPNLLQFLNKLQSCNHRLQMRELFLELCLTVPVRLSSLLPYLPLLMDPLVCALNGSVTLVQQGLRTLELCVDNLQPEYLFEHMAPVRSALIQGLWKILSTSADPQSAQAAFRILGKFGGANRRILSCPQILTYGTESEFKQAVMTVEFSRNHPDLPTITGELTLSDIVATAMEQMGFLCYRIPRMMMIQPDSSGNIASLLPHNLVNQQPPIHYQLVKESCIELARGILLSSLCPDPRINYDDWKQNVIENLKDSIKRLENCTPNTHLFRCAREHERKMYINAMVIIMMGVIQKDLRPKYVNFYIGMIRQLTLNSLLESITPQENLMGDAYRPTLCLDGSIIVDSIVAILSDTNKDFLSSAIFALSQMNDTLEVCLPNKAKIVEFPMVKYLVESVSSLCYGPAWFARLGGANGLFFIIKNFPVELMKGYLAMIAESLCEVIVGLIDEISSGAVDMSVSSLIILHKRVLLEYNLKEDPDGRLATLLKVYVPLIFHGAHYVRERAWELLNSLKDIEGAPTIEELLTQYTEFILISKARIVENLRRMSMTEQEASLASLNTLLDVVPELVGLDFEDGALNSFFDTVFDLCESDVLTLLSRDYYKSLDNCPAHFLPPFPMTTQMENLKAVAIKTLILSYKALCVNQPGDEEKKMNFTKRVLVVAVQSALFGAENIQTAASSTLTKCAPLPLDILTEVAGTITNSFTDISMIEVDKVLKMEKLISFNANLWNKDLATKFVDMIEAWQMSAENAFPTRTLEDVRAIQTVLRLILQGQVLDVKMVIKLVNFIAFFELNYTTDTDFGWITALCNLIAFYPLEIVQMFCSKKFLGNYTTFLCRLLAHEQATPIREILKNESIYFENLIQLRTLEDENWERFIAKDLEALNIYEESILRIIDTVATMETEWFVNNHKLIEQMRTIWTSPEFGDRYSVAPVFMEEDNRKLVRVQTFPASKLAVPHLFGKNFIRYLKKNFNSLDLLFDITLGFDGCFATDFGFMRDFFEQEIIPSRAIQWRIRVFEAVLERLEKNPEKYLKNSIIARVIQYILIPCFQWMFERYNSDDIFGPGLPADEENVPDPGHVMTRLTHIIENYRFKFSEQNIIAMYQFCTLIVEHMPNHIHNNECKKQGSRLRVFMVFVWNTLSSSSSTYHIDPTVRFTGYLLLAHLIDKFTINRKIVLQVYNTLLTQYQLDNRDLVRRAIDVITPAVPNRLTEDGYQQLKIYVNKILSEDSYTMGQVLHVIHAVVRNYKVYFHVKHDIISHLLYACQRVLYCMSGVESSSLHARRVVLDVCETAIKWELLKNRHAEVETNVEMELENLKQGDKDDSEMNTRPTQTTMAKEHVEVIINTLLKFACHQQSHLPQQHSTSSQMQQMTADLGRRALGLLRAALKPEVYGEIAEIKVQWMEKQLQIPAEVLTGRNDAHALNQHAQQAQQLLEVLLALAASMSRPLLLSVFKPLQRPLINCMMQSYQAGLQSHGLIRTINHLIAKLCERTKLAGVLFDDLDIIHQYLVKYLNDSFSNYYKAANGLVQQVFTPFSVIRAICQHTPEYLDATCLPSFLKVVEKAVREQVVAHHSLDQSKEKTTLDFVNVALELLRTRVAHIGAEHRRTLCTTVLLPLIEKAHEKILDCLIRIVHEILITHNDRYNTNPGLPLAIRLHAQCERRLLRSSKDPNAHPIMAPYLKMVLIIFDNQTFRNSEYTPRMANAFYWGLMSPDPEVRRQFLMIWERTQEPYVLSRLMFILKEESWHHFRKYNWLRHVIWLLFQTTTHRPFGEFGPKKSIYFGECSTLARTLETIAARDAIPSLGALNMDCTGESTFSSPGGIKEEIMEQETTEAAQEVTYLDKLVNGQKNFLLDALAYDTNIILQSVYNLMFNMADMKFTPKIFKRLFVSIWAYMLPNEKVEYERAIVPFLTSGVHSLQMHNNQSVLTPWMEAIDQTGEIKLPPKLVHFISKNHAAWHKGLLLLERDCHFLQCKYNHLSLPDIRSMIAHAYGDNENTIYRETLDYLALLYKDMDELDPYAAIWDRRAIKQETINVLNHIQRGEMKEAFKEVDDAICQIGDHLSISGSGSMITPPLEQELNLLLDQYATCCEELLEWEKLRDYANHNTVESPFLLLKAALHLPDWGMVRDCLEQLSGCIPPKNLYSYQIFQIMNNIMTQPRRDPNELINPLNQGLQNNGISSMKARIEKMVEDAVIHHIHWWRGLPQVVGNGHVKVLQSASLIREVADCIDLRVALDNSSPRDYNGELLNQMKHIIKTWKNRICSPGDELGYHGLVYDWRTQVHHMTLRRLEEWDHGGAAVPHGTAAQNILPVHSAAQGQVIVAKAAKGMRNYELAIEQMNKLHTISAVPTMDAHYKICEHLKLLRQQAERVSDTRQKYDLYQLGLHMINETDITYFAPDQVSKIFSIRGQFLGGLDKREEATKAFYLATNIMMEKKPTTTPTSAFKAWGDQQDKVLQSDQTELSAITAGAGALACFLEVVRNPDNDARAKKYIAKLIWTSKQMIALGDSATIRVNDIIERNERTTVAYNWMSWLPQIVNDIRHRPNSAFIKILYKICDDFPLQIFYYLRCVFPSHVTDAVVNEVSQKEDKMSLEGIEPWLQSMIPLMRQAVYNRQADCRVYNTFLTELHTMREFWAERQYRYAIHVRNEITRSVNVQNIQHLHFDFVLDQPCIDAVNLWREDMETNVNMNWLRESELRYLAGEYKPTTPEDIFIQETTKEIHELFASTPCPPGQVIRYLDSVISIIKTLYTRLIHLPKNIPLRLASQWLYEFNNRLACIEMPKDLFNVQKNVGASSKYTSSQYCSMIARVDPYYSVAIEGGEAVKKIFMRSINGKASTYYLKKSVKPKIGVQGCNQFISHMNHLLQKERETSRRCLATSTFIQLQVGYGSTLVEVAGSVTGEPQPVTKIPIIHPTEILSRRLVMGMQADDAVVMFYDKIFEKIIDRETKSQECFYRQTVLMEFGEEFFIGRNNLLNYFMACYSEATHFYIFRKNVAKHMAVMNILEFLLHLTPPMLQDIYITRNYGQYTVPNYTFQLPNYEAPRSVPFRLTHNFYNFLGFAADGDLRWSAEATISCMRYRSPEIFLRPLLYDFLAEMTNMTYRECVYHVNKIIYELETRVKQHDSPDQSSLAGTIRLEGVDTLMRMACSDERIALMDPALYPWF